MGPQFTPRDILYLSLFDQFCNREQYYHPKICLPDCHLCADALGKTIITTPGSGSPGFAHT